MHASLVAQRTKAIRALGSLITVDPEVLLEVRSIVSSRVPHLMKALLSDREKSRPRYEIDLLIVRRRYEML
jgi:hypothetical protein